MLFDKARHWIVTSSSNNSNRTWKIKARQKQVIGSIWSVSNTLECTTEIFFFDGSHLHLKIIIILKKT